MTIFGWAGKILRVDLSTGDLSDEDTMKYAKFIGGRGINAKIAWDEIPPEADAFDPENRLMVMTGPLNGTTTAGVGRIEFGGLTPQTYPKTRYSRSSMGGHWGSMLKYAGYDGVVVYGKSEKPVYIWVADGKAEIRDAGNLWGLDTYITQKMIMDELGEDAVAVTIGQAGEHLSRIAIVANETENAAGQGGFGAIMGSKKLKAIVARGNGPVKVAKPNKFLEANKRIQSLTRKVEPDLGLYLGKYKQKQMGCGGCPAACSPSNTRIIANVPGRVHPYMNTSVNTCVESRWVGGTGSQYETGTGWGIPYPEYKQQYPELPKKMPVLDFESGFECAVMGNKYGVNMWDVTLGMAPWLKLCNDAGIITEKDMGMPIDIGSGAFWCELLRKVAYREGIGDILAEGTPRAADILGKGHQYLTHMAHGYIEHIVGRGIQGSLPFPLWISTALIWATESRDPVSEIHAVTRIHPGRNMTEAQARAISKQIYGTERTIEPSYDYKAQRAIWHQNRSCVKDSLVLCDSIYPMTSSGATSDRSGYTAAESDLFSSVTGIEMSEAELDRVGERIFNLERAIMVREGRTKEYDLNCGVVKYLRDRPDTDGIRLDEAKFTEALEELYTLRGWDVKTGWPTRARLEELGLKDVADELGKLGRLP